MKDAILASIRSRHITTFQHLTADVPGFHGSNGAFNHVRDSIIIWHACSPAAIKALEGLIRDGLIRMHVAPDNSYLRTNDLPTNALSVPIPICRDMEDFTSDTPVIRWLPVVFTEPSTELA